MHIVLQSLLQIPAEAKNENKLIHFHMHLHMLQMHLSSILQNDASPEINVLHKKHLNHVQNVDMQNLLK